MRLRSLVAALVALVALAALACNGDGPGPTATPSAVEEAVAAPSPAAEAFSFDCAAPAEAVRPDASGFPAEVTDSVGNTVTLEAPPERIASLSAGHTEILYAIGAGDQMAVVDNASDCPQAVNDLPKVDAFSPSVEAIAGLDPDLVIIFFDPGDLQSSLQDLGVPVLNLSAPESVQGVYQQMVLLGMATGHVDEAEEVAARMEEAVGDIRSQLQDVTDGPSVFHEVDNTYFSAGPGSFVGDLYSILRAENIAEATGGAYPQMSAEAIIEADPEVIVLADEFAGESPDTVRARPGWNSISAVQNDRIYVIDPDIVSRPGPRLVEALRTLVAYLYPERFP